LPNCKSQRHKTQRLKTQRLKGKTQAASDDLIDTL
jgi:hypothetical protein